MHFQARLLILLTSTPSRPPFLLLALAPGKPAPAQPQPPLSSPEGARPSPRSAPQASSQDPAHLLAPLRHLLLSPQPSACPTTLALFFLASDPLTLPHRVACHALRCHAHPRENAARALPLAPPLRLASRPPQALAAAHGLPARASAPLTQQPHALVEAHTHSGATHSTSNRTLALYSLSHPVPPHLSATTSSPPPID